MAQPMSHAIIRWHARRALLERERAAAQARLAAAQTEAERAAAAEQTRLCDRNIRALGPDPSAKMG